jgi:hypothetical protein
MFGYVQIWPVRASSLRSAKKDETDTDFHLETSVVYGLDTGRRIQPMIYLEAIHPTCFPFFILNVFVKIPGPLDEDIFLALLLATIGRQPTPTSPTRV